MAPEQLSDAQKRDLLLGLIGKFRIEPWHVLVGVAVASIVGLLLTVLYSFTPLKVHGELSDSFVDLLGGYLILLVVLERAVGGLVTLYYRRSLVDWQLRLTRIAGALTASSPDPGGVKLVCAREKLRVAELQDNGFAKGVPDVTDDSTDDQWRNRLRAIEDSYEFLHARLLSRINTIVSSIVGGAGFVLAMLGMRLLDQILLLDTSKMTSYQASAVTLVDVVLTGAFLGGGSATISGLIAHFKKTSVSSSKPAV